MYEKIRLINIYDVSEYSRLRNSSFDYFFSKQKFTPEEVEEWLKKIDHLQDQIYVLEEAKSLLIGTVSIYNIDRLTAEVGRIVVDIEHRGRGIGLVLLNYIKECGKQRGLERLYAYIMKDNVGSRNLFEKAGYVLQEICNDSCYYELEL